MQIVDMDPRRARRATLIKWALGLVAAAVISPVIFLAVKGLIGLALAGFVGLVIINFAPVLAMKMANWKLIGIKNEAASNPVETLQNQHIERTQKLAEFRNSITDFATEVKNFEDQVDEFAREDPSNAATFQKQLQAMKQILDRRRAKYKQAAEELDNFQDAIAKTNALWKMSQAAHRMNRLAGKQAGDEFDRIKVETAIEAVQSSVNRSFAELETSLMEETPTTLIEHQPAEPLPQSIGAAVASKVTR